MGLSVWPESQTTQVKNLMVGQLKELGQGIEGEHRAKTQFQRAGQGFGRHHRQHQEHAAELHHGPGQHIARRSHTQMLIGPSTSMVSAVSTPSRALTLPATANPSRPATANVMPRRSIKRAAMSGSARHRPVEILRR